MVAQAQGATLPLVPDLHTMRWLFIAGAREKCSEFISRNLDPSAYHRGTILDFSRLGKPPDNVLVEAFNGRFGSECLNTY